MARTESAILADMSNTNAAIARLISATAAGGLGDYGIGNARFNRASSIDSLQGRLDALRKELDEIPAETITTADFEWTDQGLDQTEYVEEP